MTDTINYGIDLGTTNSAIAVAEGNDIAVIKSNDGWDITPSAVWIPTADRIYVGRKALPRVHGDPGDAKAEFKQAMGHADARYRFEHAGIELTPPQLSAEVLKSLRADAAHYAGRPPSHAVITVPAAFALHQNKATVDAAELAGFGAECPLVQEPTAAAFAYGFNDETENGYWMVFDFGGGTFDAAVVSKQDGELRVLNHDGDSQLGGKLIDWALVSRVLAPVVAREFGLDEFHRENMRWTKTFASLKQAAERAKIELSRRDQVEIFEDLPLADGSTETFQYTLRRDELDSVAEEFYVRAMNLCRSALRNASLDESKIDRLLLVGGTTLAPGLRERLADPKDGIGIPLDTRLDPTTVVARGAAIFASTIRMPSGPVAPPPPGEFAAELSYEPVTNTETATIAGTVLSSSTVDMSAYSVMLSNPDAQPPFRSAKISLNAKGAFAVEVELDPKRTSTFTIELVDGTGAPCTLTPNTVSITHKEVVFDGVRLGHSLGIQLVDRSFARLLNKGTPVPAEHRETFVTSHTLSRQDEDSVVRIPVVQGERDRGDRNRQVGLLQIRPKDVRFDLPAGSEVEVFFQVNESNMITASAEVPMVDVEVMAEIDLNDVRPPSSEELGDALTEIEQRFVTLRGSASSSVDAEQLLGELEDEKALGTAREQVQAAQVDYGAATAAEDRLRDIQAKLDDVEEAAEFPRLVAQLQDQLGDAQHLAERNGNSADRREVEEIQARVDDAVRKRDTAAVRKLIDRTSNLLVDIERRSPDWPVKVHYALTERLAGTSGRADQLIAEGRQAIAANRQRELEAVNQQLFRLLPSDEQSEIGLSWK